MSFQPTGTVWLRCINQSVREVGWAPLLVFAVHVIALWPFDAYTHIEKFDLLMHFIGGAVMAFFIHRTLLNAALMGIVDPHHPITHRILVFTATITVAVFWEFAEFVSDQTLGTLSQAGLVDTLADLLFGIIGAGFFILLTLVLSRYPDLLLARAAQRLPNTENVVPDD